MFLAAQLQSIKARRFNTLPIALSLKITICLRNFNNYLVKRRYPSSAASTLRPLVPSNAESTLNEVS